MKTLNPNDVIRLAGKPDYVQRGASSMTKKAAWNDDSMYCFDSKADTYLSYVKALIKQADQETIDLCHQYIRFWKIEHDCQNVKKAYDQLMQTPELDDSDYALVIKRDKQPTIRKYAAYDYRSIIHSASEFYDDRLMYPYRVRHEVSRKLLEKTAAQQVLLPDHIKQYLQKAAGYGVLTKEGAIQAVLCRESCAHRDHQEEFDKVSDLIDHLIDQKDEELVNEALEVIDAYDSETECGCPPIEEFLTSVDELAKDRENSKYMITLINGKVVDVRKIPSDALSLIDPSLPLQPIDELISILPTLPKPDADRIVAACG